MDVDASVRPTYVKDVTSESFRHRRVYGRVVLHHCPHFVLVEDADMHMQPIFRAPHDRFPEGMVQALEQIVTEVDDVHVFHVRRTPDGDLVAQADIAEGRRGDALWESFFAYKGRYYSNYTVLPRRTLRLVTHTWLNLFGMLEDDGGVLVLRAPNPRTLAVMYGGTGGWVATLTSLARYISQATGISLVHHRTRLNRSYDGYLTGEAAPFAAYEAHDWEMRRVSLVDRFTTLGM